MLARLTRHSKASLYRRLPFVVMSIKHRAGVRGDHLYYSYAIGLYVEGNYRFCSDAIERIAIRSVQLG